MFTDLFEELVKEAAKPVQSAEERPILARGYNRHAELRVAELLKTLLPIVQSNPQHAAKLIASRIAELEPLYEASGTAQA